MHPQEIEPALQTSRPILWGDDTRPGDDAHRDAFDAHTRATLDAIRNENRSDLEKLLVVLASSLRTRRHVVPIFVNGGGGTVVQGGDVQRELPDFPDLGQWVLDDLVYWADPAATANLAVSFVLDASLPVPMPLVLSKTGVTSNPMGLPVAQRDTVRALTTGGTLADRGVILLVFKREG